MGERKMRRKVKIGIAAIIVACLISVAAATELLTLDVKNTGTILNAPGMELMLEDKTTVVTAIDWGSAIDPTSTKTTFDIFGKDLLLHNTGNVEWWFAWTKTGLPSGTTLTCEFWNTEEITPRWQNFAENKWNIGAPVSAVPGGYTTKFRFTLTVSPTAPAGAFSFTVTFKAANSING